MCALHLHSMYRGALGPSIFLSFLCLSYYGHPLHRWALRFCSVTYAPFTLVRAFFEILCHIPLWIWHRCAKSLNLECLSYPFFLLLSLMCVILLRISSGTSVSHRVFVLPVFWRRISSESVRTCFQRWRATTYTPHLPFGENFRRSGHLELPFHHLSLYNYGWVYQEIHIDLASGAEPWSAIINFFNVFILPQRSYLSWVHDTPENLFVSFFIFVLKRSMFLSTICPNKDSSQLSSIVIFIVDNFNSAINFVLLAVMASTGFRATFIKCVKIIAAYGIESKSLVHD